MWEWVNLSGFIIFNDNKISGSLIFNDNTIIYTTWEKVTIYFLRMFYQKIPMKTYRQILIHQTRPKKVLHPQFEHRPS